jgi:hypothetical protein
MRGESDRQYEFWHGAAAGDPRWTINGLHVRVLTLYYLLQFCHH